MESCLEDKIEGRCGGFEHQVDESEHRAEKRLVSLEMARTELEVGRADLEKRIDNLALEVNRVNRLFEHEHVLNQQSKAGIFSSGVLSAPSRATAVAADGNQNPSIAHREGSSQRPQGTSHHHPLPGVSEVSHDPLNH
jgi:hypothetical protein